MSVGLRQKNSGVFLIDRAASNEQEKPVNNILLDDQTLKPARLSNQAAEHHRNEVRFWQGVALSLAIFALSLLASFVVGIGFLFLSR